MSRSASKGQLDPGGSPRAEPHRLQAVVNEVADGAKNVLEVLSRFSPSVQGKKSTVDLGRTHTTEFVSNAKA